jgi:protein-S-isoprenylcysteine O-methyltransferase Ste14
MVQVAFLIGTAGFFLISWPALRSPCAHGFFRFFAFEALLVLVLLNARDWFRYPFSALHLLSWLFLGGSILLAVHGFNLLYREGHPVGGIENTHSLVQSGAYRYIRHPLYSSLLCLGAGAFLKNPSFAGAFLLAVTLALLVATAKVEEAENRQRFGETYSEYMTHTHMLIPFLF